MDKERSTEKWVKFGMEIDDLFRPIRADQKTERGIPRGSSVILSGDMGTGKTTFLMQFLKRGIEEGERGILVSLEESSHNLLRDYCHWKIDDGTLIDAIKNDNLAVVDATSLIEKGDIKKVIQKTIDEYYTEFNYNSNKIINENVFINEKEKNEINENNINFGKIIQLSREKDKNDIVFRIIDTLEKLIYQKKGKIRVCFDSLTALLSHGMANTGDKFFIAGDIRKVIIELRTILEFANATTLFTAEAIPSEQSETGFVTAWKNVENFIARGVIQLGYYNYGKGDLVRYIRILKMRGVGHSTTRYAFEISNKKIKWIGELI